MPASKMQIPFPVHCNTWTVNYPIFPGGPWAVTFSPVTGTTPIHDRGQMVARAKVGKAARGDVNIARVLRRIGETGG